MWSWNANTLATWCEEVTHWKRPWCWRRLKTGGKGDDREWDDWMASPTQWTWVWVNSGSWWWTGRPGVLQSMGSQRVGHDWATKLNCFFKSFSLRLRTDEGSTNQLFYSYTVLPICVNESIYLLGKLPFFKIRVNHYMAWDDSPGANVISKRMLWGAFCHSEFWDISFL